MTPPVRPFDLIRIAEVLERHKVLYLTIGGACGLLHGATDYLTTDVDVMTRPDEDNRRRLAAALTQLGARVDRVITAEDLIGNTQWDTNAGPINVLTTATGPNETFFVYADVQPRSIVFRLGIDSGTTDDPVAEAVSSSPPVTGASSASATPPSPKPEGATNGQRQRQPNRSARGKCEMLGHAGHGVARSLTRAVQRHPQFRARHDRGRGVVFDADAYFDIRRGARASSTRFTTRCGAPDAPRSCASNSFGKVTPPSSRAPPSPTTLVDEVDERVAPVGIGERSRHLGAGIREPVAVELDGR